MSILAISSALPQYAFPQQALAQKMAQFLALQGAQLEQLKRIYDNSAIEKRHSVLPDLKLFSEETPPGMGLRNEIYKKEAPQLAYEAARKSLESWGGSPQKITHLIFVTCTGVMAPGVEFLLIEKLGLSRSVKRFAINFMGCFGAFKALSLAHAFAKEDPNNRILLVCTELCSLHFQTNTDLETLTGAALFADGSAAAVVGADPEPTEKPLFDMVKSASLALENSLDKMSWEAGDQGFLMRLSPLVSAILRRQIRPFAESLLVDPDCDWAIHPGGKSIIQAIERAMQLNSDQTKASWEVLAECGNMSSATFLFVLERIRSPKKWTVGIGFGPGLSVEGLLLKKRHHEALP